MQTRSQHQRLNFRLVSEQEVLCAAFGCPEPRQDASAEFCPAHQREIQEIQRWLADTHKIGWPGASAFDFERRFLDVRQRPG